MNVKERVICKLIVFFRHRHTSRLNISNMSLSLQWHGSPNISKLFNFTTLSLVNGTKILILLICALSQSKKASPLCQEVTNAFLLLFLNLTRKAMRHWCADKYHFNLISEIIIPDNPRIVSRVKSHIYAVTRPTQSLGRHLFHFLERPQFGENELVP